LYLSGSFLGLSVFQKVEDIPIRRVYSKIRIYGSGTVDNLQILDKELTNTEIEDIDTSEELGWTSNTLLLAKFDGNLIAGNIDSGEIVETVENWQITRRESDSSVLTVLDTIDVSELSFVDYTCQQDKNYIYDVFPLTDTQICQVLETEEIETDFWGWYLIGTDSDDTTYVYHLDLNVSFGGYQTEEDFTEYENFTQFNAFAKGLRKFIRGSLSAIAGTITTSTGDFLQTVDYIYDLQNRIQDISTKILKSRKGEIYKVKTHGFTANPVNDGIKSQPYIIKFDFIECENVD
jgi:hypothetical protein